MTIDWTHEAAWADTRAPLTRATGLHPAAYTDPGFHRLEQQRLFERAWVAVGTSPEVAEPGRLLVRRVGRRSILVTRDAEGTLRGFVNSCRHRGTELAAGDCDVGGIIRCPYHRWGYGLDGRLVAAPLFDEVPRGDFDPDDLGLVPVRVDTWGVLLFACLDPATQPLTDWLGDLPARMSGYGLDRWWCHEQRSIDVSADWKLISENFQEYYHLAWVHPELAKVSRVKDHYRYQGPGMYCGQTTTPVSGDDRDDWLSLPPAEGLDDSDGCSGRFVAVFPNALLAVLPSHAFVIRLDPTGVGTTTEICTFLLPPSTGAVDEAGFATTRSFWFDVNDEDIAIVEKGQRGLAGGGVPAGPLAPRFEEPLHRFHNMVADCMTSDSLGTGLTIPGGDGPTTAALYGVGVNPRPPAIDRADTGGRG
jgi:choline monooxygenase